MRTLRNSRASSDEEIRIKKELVESLQEENEQLSEDFKVRGDVLTAKETEIAHLAKQVKQLQKFYRESSQIVEEHDEDVRARDQTIAALRAQIDSQQRQVYDSRNRVADLEHAVATRDSQRDKMSQLNKDYASLILSLQAEVRELHLSKDTLSATVSALESKNAKLETKVLHKSRSAPLLSLATPASTPAAQDEDDEFPDEHPSELTDVELDYFSYPPNVRPRTMSSNFTRVGSSYSEKSLKAYRVLGAEAAAAHINPGGASPPSSAGPDGEMKQKLWNWWEEQRAGLPEHKQNVESRDTVGSLHDVYGSKRARRKLQKRYHTTNEIVSRPGTSSGLSFNGWKEGPSNTEQREHGRVWNLVRHGSFKRPVTRG